MISPLIRSLDPRRFLAVLESVDQETQQSGMDRTTAQRQAALTLLVVAVCLLIIHYLKFNVSMRVALQWLSSSLDRSPAWLQTQIDGTGFAGLIGYSWWGFWHLVGYLLIPWVFIRLVLKQPLSDFGLRLGTLRHHWKWYALLLSPILIFVLLASFREDFAHHYPFYRLASRSWFDLLTWELIYLSQFVFLEFFFRGFMLQSLKPAFGVNAIFVMCVPYLMIHFPKPWLEATGAILFGLFLGVLAMRSHSIWGGVAVHAGVAVSMDTAALLQTRGLPVTWWPL